MGTLGGFTILGAIPLGLLLGLIGLFVDGRKGWAIAATIVAGVYALGVAGTLLLAAFIA